MFNIRTLIRPAAALIIAAATASAMAADQTLAVSIISPGGHSNGNYGNVNAVQDAARSIMLIEKAAPYVVVSDIQGGNSVNSIAASADFVVTISGDQVSLKAQANKVKAAVAEGCKAENDFRGVKPGEVRKRRCIQHPLVGEVSLPVWLDFEPDENSSQRKAHLSNHSHPDPF